jgi:hypothetical protein
MSASAPKAKLDQVRIMKTVTGSQGQVTVPAAWPSGVSPLAQAVDACQRLDAGDVGMDWLLRARDSIVLPQTFGPNGRAFGR